MNRTSKALLAAVGLLTVALAAPAPAAAQEPTSVTGCIAKGSAEGTYTITDADGNTYALTSSSVKLENHVGHRVTVTGTSEAMETGMAKDTGMSHDMKSDTGMPKGDMKDTAMAHDTGAMKQSGAPALNVSTMKMLGTDCK
ncbi:MAG TPA: DUF5818 domain-containing protein [Gemmatimonadales bacterium]|nr:DUF5818 domain-containing protein [Gemmatimonadales bacterium]